jgi:hypothetical protein
MGVGADSGTTRRSRPWIPAFGLINLLEMLLSYSRVFLYAVEELQNVRYGLMPYFDDKDSDKGLKEELGAQLKSALGYLSKCCVPVGLDATKHLSDTLLSEVATGMNTDELDAKIDSIQSMARNELRQRKFFYVAKERAAFYDNKSLFGEAVAEKFPRATLDIVEAGNCYALERSTACVFHLMRVIPYGMQILAKKLKVKYGAPFECLDWGSIIQPIDKAVRQLQQSARTKKRIEDQKYYSEIVSHLYFCKDAWRNHVSHGRDPYDMPQAKSVMDHVGLVLSLLAKRM